MNTIQKLIQKEGTYAVKSDLCTYDVLTFYNSCLSASDISFETNSLLENEEYTLDIGTDGITLSASGDEGFFRAATSLMQLVLSQGKTLSFISVHDKPDFQRRGYMLDISRCRMPKPDTIKKLIDMLAGDTVFQMGVAKVQQIRHLGVPGEASARCGHHHPQRGQQPDRSSLGGHRLHLRDPHQG